MTVLTSLEKRRAYNRLYERNRRRAHDARFNIRVDPKRVTLEYPGCGYPDKMSLWEYRK